MTAICIPIFINDATDWQSDIRAAEAALAGTEGMIELRCDQASPELMLAAIRTTTLPKIVTVRPTWEGGLSTLDFDNRAALLLSASQAGVEYLDVELESWRQSSVIRDVLRANCQQVGRNVGPHLIISSHDFHGRPDLQQRIDDLVQIQIASVFKIAWKASSVTDAIDALRLVEETRRRHGVQILALAMGEFGQISRLLGAKFGQPFTFASIVQGAESAPGQPTVRDLLDLYRFGDQKSGTAVCGVIGWPIGHSLSPHIHNAGFEHVGFGGVYVPLPVEPAYEQFASIIDALRACPGMNLRGLSVTIPHKENAIRYVIERGGTIDQLSQHIGVINTIVWQQDGTVSGTNSDYAGALDALISAWGPAATREDLAGKRVAILGAGGAARAIVAGLAAHNAHTTIYNRTLAKAQALAADFNGQTGGGPVTAAPWNTLPTASAEIYINCTPLGMHPKIHTSPLDFDPNWSKETIVFDTVYNPLMTQFLQTAQRKNARIVTGLEMFIRQAAIQFEQFTSKPAPVELFRQIMTAQLQKR